MFLLMLLIRKSTTNKQLIARCLHGVIHISSVLSNKHITSGCKLMDPTNQQVTGADCLSYGDIMRRDVTVCVTEAKPRET